MTHVEAPSHTQPKPITTQYNIHLYSGSTQQQQGAAAAGRALCSFCCLVMGWGLYEMGLDATGEAKWYGGCDSRFKALE
jgi:hypothetical protein